jgi:hypothetical protein
VALPPQATGKTRKIRDEAFSPLNQRAWGRPASRFTKPTQEANFFAKRQSIFTLKMNTGKFKTSIVFDFATSPVFGETVVA